jgi:hypothetical protein
MPLFLTLHCNDLVREDDKREKITSVEGEGITGSIDDPAVEMSLYTQAYAPTQKQTNKQASK